MNASTNQESAYVLTGAVLTREGKPVLGPFSLSLRNRAITVVLGPAGTGKSTLLGALAGQLRSGVLLHGDWRRAGNDVRAVPAASAQVSLCEQRRAGDSVSPESEPPWRTVLSSSASIVLLDEPTRGCSESEVEELVEELVRHKAFGCAVVVTHDIAFARRVADDVCFFIAGALNVFGPAPLVFDRPPTRVFARFLAQGNGWPSVPPPALPAHFRWILPGQLAGMACPGLFDDLETELSAIALAGIQTVVSLTEEPFPTEQLRAFGLQGRHLPIRDMNVPAVGPAARLCRDIERNIESGRPVAVHCRAGMGRTGTILAAYLVWRGASPEEAIAEVRAVSPGYIQNRQQELFVHRFKEGV